MATKSTSGKSPLPRPASSDNDAPPPTVPEPAHFRESHERSRRLSDISTSSDDSREATELRSVSADSGVVVRPRISRVLSPGKPQTHWYDPVKRYWRHEIRISVPHVDCRDHLANERTFLGYLRTSVILSMLGTFIAQFYRLQHRPNPSDTFGYYVMSKPLSVVFQCAALCVVLLGGWRFWSQQSAMARGRVRAGGWELFVIGAGMLLLLLMLFGVHIALDIVRESGSHSIVL